MRDFRDAKAMAHTLRAALATRGHKVTNSESLELIAQAFGVADWNTLSAAIRDEAAGPHNNAPAPQFPTTATMHRALAYARQRKHQYATLEHLLLALIDDVDASAVMKACKVDLGALKAKLTNYIDNDLKTLVIDDGGEPKHTAGFQRVVQRAAHYAEGRVVLTGPAQSFLWRYLPRQRAPPRGFSPSRTWPVKTQSTSSSTVSQRVAETAQLSRCRKL
jgi:Glyoxalase superfamily protein/Clp amino terminal domain, pathogenicity island component